MRPSLFLLLLAACAPHDESDLAAVDLAAGEAGPFRADGAAFRASYGTRGLQVDTTGLRVDGIGLRTVAMGRATLQTVGNARPVLGECATPVDASGACDRRIERRLGDIAEWWARPDAGIEQGWELTTPPPGVGELVVAVRVEGARLRLDGDHVELTADNGTVWTYGALAAWDADGDTLPARFSVDGDEIRVHVDDTGATFPIHIDPVLSTASATVSGETSGDQFGYSAASAGDVNNDGYDDLVVGAFNYASSTGRVYVYHGSATGLSTTAATTITGEATGDTFGWAVASAGDYDGDGYDDIIVGAPGSDTAAADAGKAYIYYGSSSGISSASPTTINPVSTASAAFGRAVGGGVDLDADGRDDVIIGAPYASAGGTSAGAVYTAFRDGSGTSTTRLEATGSAGDQAGWTVAMGNLDGDAYGDIAYASTGYSSSHGRITARTNPAGTVGVLTFDGEANGDNLGESLIAADFDNDGLDDLAAGAPGYDGAYTSSGKVYLKKWGGSFTSIASFTGSSAMMAFGGAVAAGDFNSDGYNDLVVGAPALSSATGKVFLFESSSTTLAGGADSSASQTFTGAASFATLGHALAVGDYDGDTRDDLGIASGLGAGSVAIYPGSAPVDADSDGYAAGSDCDDTNPAINPGATEVCDAFDVDEDCDGNADNADSSATGKVNVYADGDGDGYGTGSAVAFCDVPATGYAPSAGDCNDTINTVNPGAAEICDPADNDEDCDGVADNSDPSVTGGITVYRDGDNDGYGDVTGSSTCDLMPGYTLTSGDCDDAAFGTHPGATEVCDSADRDEDCNGTADNADGGATGKVNFYTDGDGDGYGTGVGTSYCDAPSGYSPSNSDCNDANAAINPGATEICDPADVDEDCDIAVDDGDSSVTGKTTWYSDGDGDGYGVASPTTTACNAPSGFVANTGDCNDSNSGVNPSAAEICDAGNNDEDCDGSADDADTSVTGKSTWYLDSDGDGFGGSSTTSACDTGTGYTASASDCNDGNAAINPAAAEVCDPADVDEDCDGAADNADAGVTGGASYYRDGDSDGYGAGAPSSFCDLPAGYATTDTDCNDGNPGVNPGAAEVCDVANNDEDCDGTADDADSSVTGGTTYYHDGDGDGYAGGTATVRCDDATGYSTTSSDCNDSVWSINPGATEICDAANTDEDCDGSADDADSSATGKTGFFPDSDGDGYGGGASVSYCDAPTGYSASNTDCNDANAAMNPGATEVCDPSNVDEDCDASADDADPSVTGKLTYYLDADGDSYGTATTTTTSCDAPSGYVTVSTDCNDGAVGINPGATELCDGANTDEDCDGAADNADSSATGKTTFYVDADGDSWGGTTPGSYCDAPSGYASTSTDCNDGNASIYPMAPEKCDASDVDEDCDGKVEDADSDSSGKSTWYRDGDSDGYGGSTSTTTACDQPSGYTGTATDCNDGRADVNPAAAEVCDPGDVDEDCDGLADDADTVVAGTTTFYEDGDDDGYGSSLTGTTEACDAPDGFFADDDDCDDTDAAYHPDATEDCADPKDYNCDGSTGFDDQDGDTVAACEDCDDLDATAFPGGIEVCGDDADNDCNGEVDEPEAVDAVDFYFDADGDTYGDSKAIYHACEPTGGYVGVAGDCDDGSTDFHPGALETCDDPTDYNCDGTVEYTDDDSDGYAACEDCDDGDPRANDGAVEICDGIDNDCDGVVDTDAGDVTRWYADTDGDGYGDPGDAVTACDAPTGYVANASDCDDASPLAHPGATEVCDGIDNDCDGTVDGAKAIDVDTWFLDADGDGYGDTTTATPSCDTLVGYVSLGGDCDDTDGAYNPGATESCSDTADYNCDGSVGYEDRDGDGQAACEECNDADPTVYLGAVEVCDDKDNDCDGGVDNDATDAQTWYADADHDGFGDGATGVESCDGPSGYITDDTDCDDADAGTHPGAAETCTDTVDLNCDGSVGYNDADGDGYAACEECDDTDASVHPGVTELCDGVDNDCSGAIDDDAVDALVWYADADRDGYGDEAIDTLSCEAPDGYVDDDTDCDDSEATAFPGNPESCDGIDNDCDGTVDDGTGVVLYVDADGDGYGDPSATVIACEMSSGYVPDSTDCDDTNAAIKPYASETCDDLDNDCDGAVDEGCPPDTGDTGDSGDTADTTDTAETGVDTGETGSETGSETGTETGSETGTETGEETGTETGTETGSETGETGSETGETGAETGDPIPDDTFTEDTGKETPDDCGCTATPSRGGLGLLFAVGLAALSRRR